MSADKVYPARILGGVPERVAASEYKILLQKHWGVEGNIVPTRVSGALWGPYAKIYDEFSSAVTAIERGQKSNWHPSNLISGMNAPSLEVREASIKLLEICRKELEDTIKRFKSECETIKNSGTYNFQEKKDMIAQKKSELGADKAFIFGLLEQIRNANARERTFKWSSDFFSSLFGKYLRPSLNKTNISLAVLGLGICVALPILGAAALAGSYVLPVVLGLFCFFLLCKLVQAVYNTWQDANRLATQSKTASGNKILQKVAAFDEANLATPQKDMDNAEAIKQRVETTIAQKKKELEAKIRELKTGLANELAALDSEEKSLETLRDRKLKIINTSSVYSPLEINAARDAVRKIDADLLQNSTKKADLNEKLGNITSLPVIRCKRELERLKTNELARATRNFNDKKEAYDRAKDAAQKSTDRANKINKSTPVGRPFREILGDPPVLRRRP